MAAPRAQTLAEKLIAENPSDYVETPSAKQVRENQKSSTKIIKDSLDRTIVYRPLGPLEQMRLYKAMGDLSANEAYMRYAMLSVSVQSIDGDRGPPPATVLSTEARVAWVGEEGFAAIWAELIRGANELTDSKSAEEIAEEHRQTLKKSSSDQDSENVSTS